MFTVDRFIEDCRAGLRERAPESAIREVLARALSAPGEITAALGTPSEGGIAALHHSPELTVLHVVWAPGMAIYPHDHRMWALIGLYQGREDNTFYRRDPAGLVEAGGRQLGAPDAALLGQHLIHSVSNPGRTFTGAIHIYGGDFFATPRSEWDPETREERPYDVARALRTFAEANERWRRERGEVPTPG
jgi:predicted metal-dependent enzyme (double-stranded beta helix superfamily)